MMKPWFAKAKRAQDQAYGNLHAALRKMVNDPKVSDVVFVCQDGKRVHGCRRILQSRSLVLDKMLTNGMAETYESEISLNEISSTTLISIFEFLYSGTTVLDLKSSDWRPLLEIMSAAQFLMVENLEEMVRIPMEATFQLPTAMDPNEAAKRLSMAMNFPNLFEDMESIPLQLIKVLNFNHLEPATLLLLSKQALHYLLAHMLHRTKSPDSSEDSSLSLGEYLKWRQIVLWLACKLLTDLEEVKTIMGPYLPDRDASLLLLKEPPAAFFQVKDDSPENITASEGKDAARVHTIQFLKLKEKMQKHWSPESLFALVDFQKIHPELLIRVVEPLGIVPPSQLFAALGFHALHRPRTVKGRWADVAQGSCYRVGEDKSVIQKCRRSAGFAIASHGINQPGVYVWDIIIEEVCHTFCQVGIYKKSAGQEMTNFNGISLGEAIGGWALIEALNMTHNRRPYINKTGFGRLTFYYGQCFVFKGGRVRVHLDMFHHVCSFSINGTDFGPAWNDLPEGVYYPAVSLGNEVQGKVRIELVSGFDLL
ncbi:unnamed protein product [Calypogeia fissa]